MRIDYLADRPAGTALVAGPADGSAPMLATVIVRTAFDLTGSNPRSMVPSTDDARNAVAMTDLPFDVPLNGDQDEFFFEADTALRKPLADVVVRGRLRNPSTSAVFSVGGTTWLTRGAPLNNEGDSTVNLFGYQGRQEGSRRPANPNVPTASFSNFYRRSASFGDAGMTQTALPAGAVVSISETNGANTSSYSLTLPDPMTLRARYFTYCGHGKDAFPNWNPGPAIDLLPDTLIVDVDADTAVILWRGSWGFADQPQDLYRSIQISEGGF